MGRAELEGRGLGLAPESAADIGLDDPDPCQWHLQDPGHLLLQVVRHLTRRPQGEAVAARVPLRDGTVGLDGRLVGEVADEAL